MSGKKIPRGNYATGNLGTSWGYANGPVAGPGASSTGSFTFAEAQSFPHFGDASSSQAFPSLGWSNQPAVNFSNNPTQSINFDTATQAGLLAHATLDIDTLPKQQAATAGHFLNTSPADPPSSTAALIPTAFKSSPSHRDPLPFVHLSTGRPVRKLLEHENLLLNEFYFFKNPKASKLIPRELEEWRLSLRVHEIEEWNDFVFTRQSGEEAEARLESVAVHDTLILKIKETERKALARKDRLLHVALNGKKARRSANKKKNTGKKAASSK
jgi:hypothetical protein